MATINQTPKDAPVNVEEYSTDKLVEMLIAMPERYDFGEPFKITLNKALNEAFDKAAQKSQFTAKDIKKHFEKLVDGDKAIKSYREQLQSYLRRTASKGSKYSDILLYADMYIEHKLRDRQFYCHMEFSSTHKEKKYSTVSQLKKETMLLKWSHSSKEENKKHFAFNHNYVFDPQLVSKAIEEKSGSMTAEQRQAVLDLALSPNMCVVLEGYAGAGKSTTMSTVKKVADQLNYKTIGLALPWSASQVLKNSLKAHDCKAIDAFNMEIKRAGENIDLLFPQPTMLIVDEAGLVDVGTLFPVLEAASKSKHPVKVIITGDTKQLLPVNAGSALSLIVSEIGSSKITQIFRQYQQSDREIVNLLAQGRAGEAVYLINQKEGFVFAKDKEDRERLLVRDFLSYKLANPQKSVLILSYTNAEIANINKQIRDYYKQMGFVYGEEVKNVPCTDGKETFYNNFAAGDEVIVRFKGVNVNQYAIPVLEGDFDIENYQKIGEGVFNRNAGRIVNVERLEDGSCDLTVDLTGEMPARIILNTKKFKDMEKGAFPVVHNFATTIYSSQGQTVDKVFFMDGGGLDARNTYVGYSRHREECTVYLDVEDLTKRIDGGMKKGLVYSKKALLNEVAKTWAKESENEASITIERRSAAKDQGLQVEEVGVSQEERVQRRTVQPVRDNFDLDIADFDPYREEVLEGDDWISIIKRINQREYKQVNVLDENEVNKWIEKVKTISNFPDDYELEAGDIIFYKPRYNLSYDIVKMQSLDKLIEEEKLREQDILKDGEATELNELISQEEIKHKFDVMGKPIEDDRKEYNGKIYEQVMKGLDGDINQNHQRYEEPKLFTLEGGIETQMNNREVRRKSLSALLGLKPKDDPVKTELNKEADNLVRNLVSNELQQLEPTERRKKYLEQVAVRNEKIKADREERLSKVEFYTVTDAEASYNRKMLLDFHDPREAPSQEFLKITKGTVWDEGRGKPRVLAANIEGEVQSRYSLDGRCMVGEGFPPIIVNDSGVDTTPFMIVSNAKDYLYQFEKNFRKAERINDLTTAPHLLWGAKGVDYHNIFNKNRNSSSTLMGFNFIIRINPHIETDREWALNTRKYLWEQFGVKTIVQSSQEIINSLPPPPFTIYGDEKDSLKNDILGIEQETTLDYSGTTIIEYGIEENYVRKIEKEEIKEISFEQMRKKQADMSQYYEQYQSVPDWVTEQFAEMPDDALMQSYQEHISIMDSMVYNEESEYDSWGNLRRM